MPPARSAASGPAVRLLARHARPLALLTPFVLLGAGPSTLLGVTVPRPSTPCPARATLAPAPSPSAFPTLDAVDLHHPTLVGDALRAPLRDGHEAVLTLDPVLQTSVQSILDAAHAPRSAAVVLALDGRVLALAGATRDGSDPLDAALTAWAPAASVFKIVTALALAHDGVAPTESACFHGGEGGLWPGNLVDDRRRDRRCYTLEQALARSCNAVVAKIALRHLVPDELLRTARTLGYDTAGGAPSARVSTASLPGPLDGRLAFARASAGFGEVHLSPFFAAVIGETLANAGLQVQPRIIAAVVRGDGTLAPAPPPAMRFAAWPLAAAEVDAMLRDTARYGTAARNFHGRHGAPLLPFDVVGKTGSLTRTSPTLHCHWFVGYAPADHPQIAFAVLVGNSIPWKVRATLLAERILASWAVEQGMPLPVHPVMTLAAR